MYNLSPRLGKPTRYGTPDSLGPNSYILCDGTYSRKKNVAPFLSTSARNFAIGATTFTDAIYDASSERKIKSGSSMQNRAKRFVYKADDTPGPMAYDPKIRTKKCPKLDPTPIPGKGKLYMCRVPYSTHANGPSIPSHIDENGYEVVSGRVVKVPPNDNDHTLGPAFYDVPPESELNYKPYVGNAWSASKTKRAAFRIDNNPSPADYYVKLDCKPMNHQDEEYREMARLLTFLPRYIEAKQLQTISEDLPGPAYYNVKDSSLNVKQSLSINPVPLICGAKRFRRTVSHNPAPGQYDVTNSFMRHKQFSMKRTAFGIQSDRFPKKKVDKAPGAADYQVTTHTIVHRSMKKVKRYSTVYAPFDKQAPRKIGFMEPDALLKPGPAEYTIESETEPMAANASVFKSTKIRFPEKEKVEMSPATYSTTYAFNKLKNQTSHNKTEVPFDTKAPKCVQKINKNPGPGEYYNPPEPENKGYYFNVSPREQISDSDTPGPGSYTVHPAMDNSLYKTMHTHNLRLKENVLCTKLRQSPHSTYLDWMREIKKTKKLRWFAAPTENYRHCIFAL